MATRYSPKIVTDGLVLALDAANVKSFRGEPTTNVVTNALPTAGWNTANAQGSTITRSFLTENNVPFMRFSNVTNGNDYPRVTDSAFANSSTITGSFSTSLEVRGTPGAQLRLRIYENGSTKITNTITLTNEWVRYKFENQSTAFALNQPYFNPATTGATYDIRNIQIEQKPYATPFVNGTRGTTVAAGGGWADRSGNGNHGELVNGPTFDAREQGSISFDGVNDYVNVPSDTNLDLTSQGTISIWINPAILTQGNFAGLVARNTGGSINQQSYTLSWRQVSGGLFGQIAGGSGVNNDVLAPFPTVANVWYNIVFTWNGSQLVLYNNGVVIGTTTQTINSQVLNTDLTIGGRTYKGAGGSGEPFNGKIANTKLYSRGLTSAEVQQNYNATKGRFGL